MVREVTLTVTLPVADETRSITGVVWVSSSSMMDTATGPALLFRSDTGLRMSATGPFTSITGPVPWLLPRFPALSLPENFQVVGPLVRVASRVTVPS